MKLHSNKRAGSSIISNLKSQISNLGRFFRNLLEAFLRFNNKERVIFFALATTLIVLVYFEAQKIYTDSTKLVPAEGGEYVEAMMGEAKYFTPILAKTDAEKAIVQLTYSALIKVDENNQPQPDLATSWEISPDALVYTFHLRPNVTFQKGQSFESEDVAATIESIKEDANKSPLKDTWANITVDTPDPETVVFHLPKNYGPFIYNCAIEIIDSGDAVSGSLSSSYNGTGPYSFLQATPDGNGSMVVSLKSNPIYYSAAPLIGNIKFLIAKDDAAAQRMAKEYQTLGFAGFAEVPNKDDFDNKSFKTNRNLIIFINTRKEALKNIDFRRKILAGTALEAPTKLTLLSLNADPQKSKAEEFAKSWKDKNLELELKLVNATDYTDAVKKKDYDLLMYGYNWAYDRDPYLFWHSSQLEQSNFSGFSDKGVDIMLEDARLLTDSIERNKRYDEIYAKVAENALAIYYDTESYPFFISGVKNVQIAEKYGRPEDRFNNIANWYIKEKRVRK